MEQFKSIIATDGVHIAGADLAELHEFARRAGIKRCWFHRHKVHPHYDKPKRYPLEKLLQFGAQLVSSKIILRLAELAGEMTTPASS
jgi:hypothetical protein